MSDQFFCRLCNVDCYTEQVFLNHQNSAVHMERGKLKLGAFPGEASSTEQTSTYESQSFDTNSPYEEAEVGYEHDNYNEDENYEGYEEDSEYNSEFFCQLCNCETNSQAAYAVHIKGQRHVKNLQKQEMANTNSWFSEDDAASNAENSRAVIMTMLDGIAEPLLGLQHVSEYRQTNSTSEPRYLCHLCKGKCDPRTLLSHLVGSKHCVRYIKQYRRDYYMVIAKATRKSEVTKFVTKYSALIEQEEGRHEIQVVLDSMAGEHNWNQPRVMTRKRLLLMSAREAKIIDMRIILDDILKVEVTNEEEAALAFHVSNSLMQSLLRYRSKSRQSEQQQQIDA